MIRGSSLHYLEGQTKSGFVNTWKPFPPQAWRRPCFRQNSAKPAVVKVRLVPTWSRGALRSASARSSSSNKLLKLIFTGSSSIDFGFMRITNDLCMEISFAVFQSKDVLLRQEWILLILTKATEPLAELKLAM